MKEKPGAPGEIRTPDLMLRRHSLYPAELRARSRNIITCSRRMGSIGGGSATKLGFPGAALTPAYTVDNELGAELF